MFPSTCAASSLAPTPVSLPSSSSFFLFFPCSFSSRSFFFSLRGLSARSVVEEEGRSSMSSLRASRREFPDEGPPTAEAALRHVADCLFRRASKTQRSESETRREETSLPRVSPSSSSRISQGVGRDFSLRLLGQRAHLYPRRVHAPARAKQEPRLEGECEGVSPSSFHLLFFSLRRMASRREVLKKRRRS